MAAFKAGRKAEARELLLELVDKDAYHEQAWLYLSALVESLQEQQTCLENVLELNPANEKARKALEKVRQKLGRQKQEPPPAPSSTPPFASLDWDAIPEPPLPKAPSAPSSPSTPPIGAEFATISGDSLVGGEEAPQEPTTPFELGGAAPEDALDWLSTPSLPPAQSEPPAPPSAPAVDPFASPTSVDWGREADHAVHGSGQQVNEPSPQQYDDWVRNLNLGGSSSPSPEPETLPTDEGNAEHISPFTSEGVAPFGGTEFMLEEESEALSADEPPAPETPSPFDVNIFEAADTPWSNEEAASPPLEGAGVFTPQVGAALDTVSDDVFEGGTPFVEAEMTTVEDESVFVGAATDAPPEKAAPTDALDFSFESAPKALRHATRNASASPKDPNAAYLAQIPADIEPPPALTRRGMLLAAAIVVMIVLNGVSFALLL